MIFMSLWYVFVFQVPRFKERVPGKRFNRADVRKWVGGRLKAEWKKTYKYISNLSQRAVGCCHHALAFGSRVGGNQLYQEQNCSCRKCLV